MPLSSSFIRESRATFVLALPLIAGQLSQMLIALADTVMIGRVGVVPLAAAALSNNILHLPFMFGIGMAIAVSVRTSQARGADDPAGARGALRHGLYLALAIGLLTALGAFFVPVLFPFLRQDADVIASMPAYFQLVAISMIPGIAALAVKSHVDGMNRPWPALWIFLGGVLLNIFLNWILIYGNLGAPRMELEGAGLATLIARLMTFVCLIIWVRTDRKIKDWVPRRFLRMPDWKAMQNLLRIGFPASLQLLAEVGAFVAAAIIIGTLGSSSMASHQVAITCAATVYMVPLGLSMALTVRIGEAWGADEFSRLRTIVVSGGVLAAAFTIFSAQPFIWMNHSISGFFLVDLEAAALAASLLLISAAFQFSDAMQIVATASLRGMNDVRTPAMVAVFAYWGISLPLGSILAFPLGLGVAGMWWGLTAGLTVTALWLSARIWQKTKQFSANGEP